MTGSSPNKNKSDDIINPVNVTFALKCHAASHPQKQALHEFLNFSSKEKYCDMKARRDSHR
jgi:hypothetical protein